MVLQGPPIKRHAVSIVTTGFQMTGELEAIGPVFSFINDPKRDSLSFYDVQVMPLVASGPLKGFSRPHVILRRSEIVLLYLESAESRDSIRTLRRSEQMVAYTPVAVCRANFHMADEANIYDFLEDIASILLPITAVQLFPLTEFPAPFPTEPDLLLLSRYHLQFYHPV